MAEIVCCWLVGLGLGFDWWFMSDGFWNLDVFGLTLLVGLMM